VLAAEHLLDLARLHFGVEGVERYRELGVNRLACLCPLDEDGQVVASLPERDDEVPILLQAPPALQDLLSLSLVLPEVRRRGKRLESVQFVVRAGGLKDSSASSQRAC
jgi:hypothetical protein